MKVAIRCIVLLAATGVVAIDPRTGYAATADWAEEMDAAPGVQWGLWDDFQDPAFKNSIDFATAPGVWIHPSTIDPTGSQGMVLVDGGGNPVNALPSMAGPGAAQYTAEIRYKIITPAPEPDTGVGNDSLWFNVGGGHGAANSGADIRMFEGHEYRGAGFNFQTICGEGFNGCSPGIDNPAFTGTSRGEWHTLRMIQDEIGQTQRVYIDGVLLSTQDMSSYNRSFNFSRGLAFGFYNHPDASVEYPEVHYDYIRLANGIVPVGEPINAPSVGGCAGNLNGDATTDGADVAIIYNAWGTNNALADIDDSGTVDGADLAAVYNCWNQADTAAVPEPSGLAWMALGLASVFFARRP